MTFCPQVMVARYGGRTVSLSDCAALVGLEPAPRIKLVPGEELTLLAQIKNVRPPLPTTTDPDVLRLEMAGSGSTLGTFKAEQAGRAQLVIEHPGKAVCVQQPTDRCLVAVVEVSISPQ